MQRRQDARVARPRALDFQFVRCVLIEAKRRSVELGESVKQRKYLAALLREARGPALNCLSMRCGRLFQPRVVQIIWRAKACKPLNLVEAQVGVALLWVQI